MHHHLSGIHRKRILPAILVIQYNRDGRIKEFYLYPECVYPLYASESACYQISQLLQPFSVCKRVDRYYHLIINSMTLNETVMRLANSALYITTPPPEHRKHPPEKGGGWG